MAAGLALALAELAGPGFFIIFLAVGALASAGLAALWPASPLWAQLLNFSVVSGLSLLIFRKPLMRRFGLDGPPLAKPEILAESAFPLEDIAPGAEGKAELRGTAWTARNGGDAILAKGRRCKVERVEGLTIWLKAD